MSNNSLNKILFIFIYKYVIYSMYLCLMYSVCMYVYPSPIFHNYIYTCHIYIYISVSTFYINISNADMYDMYQSLWKKKDWIWKISRRGTWKGSERGKERERWLKLWFPQIKEIIPMIKKFMGSTCAYIPVISSHFTYLIHS